MTYTVLARRYRSQTFDEVVGQEHIARTLRSAIDQGRVAHAYLFVGTRGVGKTTMARLLAKALNGGSDEVDRAIMAGQDTDVIEIDAASNRGVDEARDLIANSVYRPMRGSYKVYIIDEVHMLTREAFNTLLKTLEEPPSHVKFILCTTEPHKVLPTIQSRCQRFDFRNIASSQIAEHLKSVVEREGLEAEPDLLQMVARMAAGSMRDALSLMDRLLAAAEPGEPMSVALLERLLGLPERDVLFSLIESLAGSDAKTALEQTNDLLMRGVGPEQLLESLIETLRDLMLISVCGAETDLVEVGGEARQRAVDLTGRFDAGQLTHMIALCESVERSSKSSSNPRAILDALIVRLAMTEQVAEVAALLRGGDDGRAASPAGGGGRRKKAEPAVGDKTPRNNAAAEPPAENKQPSESTSQAPQVSPASISQDAPDDVRERWRRVCECAAGRMGMRVMLQKLHPVEIDDARAVLQASDARHLAYARGQAGRLAELFKEALGSPVRIELTQAENAGDEENEIDQDRVDPSVFDDDLVREAMRLFDARVVSVQKDQRVDTGGDEAAATNQQGSEREDV